ncbi:gamma-glutamyltransferase [Rhodovarius crocodyli]|uniref:Glutathione hydrolase proenzyme n=1 Tax=Rhodovarius crocodyli TaxID=1979269 RepID=A0A437MIH3_9PROT|nr:gamma-glutamyltransferase [Rhodovarius crocodyli]RVT97439.1 gamma-glutamyltransferase [Rhodovarius crocodyli]
MTHDWRAQPGTRFATEKTPVTAERGMAITNHPLASAAAMEMMAMGGNAIDATVAALFTLTVVEPMMVGFFGGGVAVIRLADGREVVLDSLSTAPALARPDMYRPIADTWPDYMETVDRENRRGINAIAVPGTLKGWCEVLERFGTLPLPAVLEPAIRHAANGFRVTPYLATCIEETAIDLELDPGLAAMFLPGGKPLPAGSWLRMPEYATTLRGLAEHGPDWMYGGELGQRIAAWLEAQGSTMRLADLENYRTVEREPVRGNYRGVDLLGPAPPCSGGVHVVQMLNLMEGFDIRQSGFGTAETLHLILEALKIAAADRRAATADPAFVDVPVARLVSKEYGHQRRPEIDPARTHDYTSHVLSIESANTTHVTIADGAGNIVTSTQTLNSLFGARVMIPGTGIIPNNYMYLFDPHPGNALSLQPGKRITSGISAMIGFRDGAPLFAVGLPGAHRIPSAVFQFVMNVVDHGMSIQEAVEAPRVFTHGHDAEVERGFPPEIHAALAAKGHAVVPTDHVAGGMSAILFEGSRMTGAACWRADGVAMGYGGGLAREGTSFWPDPRRQKQN